MTAHTITAEELEKFTTNNRREILFYLNQLINDGERISVIFDGGNETVLTVLLEVDDAENMLIFDWGGSETSNRKLLQSERSHYVCAPHGVRNQFTCGTVREVMHQKRRAFATRLPGHYTRLQRREFFRLVLPMTRRPPCVIAQEPDQPLTLSVVDISVGGVACEFPAGTFEPELGNILPRARIDLKTIGTLEVDLEVRNQAELTRGGKVSHRIGCSFIKLSHAMENQLQRFITDVQREERARLGG